MILYRDPTSNHRCSFTNTIDIEFDVFLLLCRRRRCCCCGKFLLSISSSASFTRLWPAVQCGNDAIFVVCFPASPPMRRRPFYFSLLFFSSFPLFSFEIFTSHTLHLNRERTYLVLSLKLFALFVSFSIGFADSGLFQRARTPDKTRCWNDALLFMDEGGDYHALTGLVSIYSSPPRNLPPPFFPLNLKIKMKYLFTSEIYLSREMRKKYRLNRSHTHHQKLFYDWESFF